MRKARVLPVYTGKQISGAVLETAYNAGKAAAIWKYIGCLLDFLASQTGKIYTAIILQEISNVYHLEYSRTNTLHKRNVQISTYATLFKRIPNVYGKAGNARLAMKAHPDVLTGGKPRLHYILRLCQLETNALKATVWIKKTNDPHEAHPSEP
jgi:hypothetical protein